ncbi:hypothetical protein ACFWY9_11220 [Amycolatopsis sp. NPDC059027]
MNRIGAGAVSMIGVRETEEAWHMSEDCERIMEIMRQKRSNAVSRGEAIA